MTISPYIKSIGFELECGIPYTKLREFERHMREKYGDRFEADTDGSVGAGGTGYQGGKEYKFYSDKWEEIEDFLKEAYTTYGVKTDRTCGLHMHFKTNPDKIEMKEAVALLSYKPIHDEFINEYKTTFQRRQKFLNRLKGRREGGWADPEYKENEILSQLEARRKHDVINRYTAINLQAYNEHGTVELRPLPPSATAVGAIGALKQEVKILDRVFKKYTTLRDEMELEGSESSGNKAYTKEELEAYKDSLEAEDVNVRMRV